MKCLYAFLLLFSFNWAFAGGQSHEGIVKSIEENESGQFKLEFIPDRKFYDFDSVEKNSDTYTILLSYEKLRVFSWYLFWPPEGISQKKFDECINELKKAQKENKPIDFGFFGSHFAPDENGHYHIYAFDRLKVKDKTVCFGYPYKI